MDLMGTLQIPTNKLDIFIRSVEISSYLPGRVRLYSKNLVNNAALEKEVQQRLLSFAEIEKVETNTLTGSILIGYRPEVLRRNSELKKVEQYIIAHAKKK